jgi:hypothetical protein
MSSFLARRGVRAALAGVTLFASVSLAAPAPASAETATTLQLSSLAFETNRVDARGDWTVVALQWTVKNSDADAGNLYGTVKLNNLEDSPVSRVGQTYTIGFDYGWTGYMNAEFVSGTPQESTYRYYFVVPRFGRTGDSKWRVTEFTTTDDAGHSLTLDRDALAAYGGELDALTQIDQTGPAVDYFRYDPRPFEKPFAYVKDAPAHVSYQADVSDLESGFWKGDLRLNGPDGQFAGGAFEATWFQADRRCGAYSGGTLTQMTCGVTVEIAKGAASGVWRVGTLTLVDNVGNTSTTTPAEPTTVTVTSNEVVTASDFVVTPNPVDNWRQDVVTRVGARVSGAHNGVAAMHVSFDTNACNQTSTTPTVGDDGRYTVPVRVNSRAQRCKVTGLAVVDGDGHAAVYGSMYEAPPVNLVIEQLPNTIAPTATEATLTPTTVPLSQAGWTAPLLTIKVDAPIAPVSSVEVKLYDSAGNEVGTQFGGTSADANGYLREYTYILYSVQPGVYTYGFTLYDESGLHTTYGPKGIEPPGGPLQITVTEG